MPEPPKRIEIIEIGTDEKLKKEIEESSKLPEGMRSMIKEHLDGLKKQPIKTSPEKRKWEGKLDTIFGVLKEAYDKDPKIFTSKLIVMQSINCDEKDFSPLMQKFKNYLRTTKEDKWTIFKKNVKGISSYALVPFA